MRFSTSFVLAAAIGAYALPQDVQPITQISDGQIQAPPATGAASSAYETPTVVLPTETEVPSVPAATEVLPSVTPVPLPSVVEPVPSVSVPANVSVPAVSSGASYPNSTVAVPTGGESGSATGTGASPSETAPINNGATANMASFAVVAAALLAYLA